MEIQDSKGQTWPDGKPLSCPVVDSKAVNTARLIEQYFSGRTTISPKEPDAHQKLSEMFGAAKIVADEVLSLETALHGHAYKLFSRPTPPKSADPSAN
jgi:hypothetical protein